MNNNIQLLKLISTLTKTIDTANQIIPIYKKIKPIITKSNETIHALKSDFVKPKKVTNNSNYSNNPIFFQ